MQLTSVGIFVDTAPGAGTSEVVSKAGLAGGLHAGRGSDIEFYILVRVFQ
jgi:hypothetical protein